MSSAELLLIPSAWHLIACDAVSWLFRGLRQQGVEASKAAGSELIISLCKAGERMEALQVYEDMTAPVPTVRQHNPHIPGEKSASKAAAKQQRTKQRGPADSTAVAFVPAASEPELAVATASGSEQTSQMDSLRQLNTASTQQETPMLKPGQSQHTAQLKANGLENANTKLVRTDSRLTAAPSSAEVTSAEPLTAPQQAGRSRLADLQAPVSEPSSGHSQHSESSAAAAQVSASSSSSSSSNKHADAADVQTLMSKPGRRMAPHPAEAVAGSNPEQINDAAHRHQQFDASSHFMPEAGTHSNSRADPMHGADSNVNDVHGADMGSKEGQRPGRGSEHGIERDSGSRPVAPGASGSSGSVRHAGSLKLSQKAICFPSIGATAALVHAFAIADDIHQSFRSVCHHRLYSCL